MEQPTILTNTHFLIKIIHTAKFNLQMARLDAAALVHI